MSTTPMDRDKRIRANFRERKRISEMNAMFDELLGLLPPSNFKMRLSRVQILREATDYISRLVEYLGKPPTVDPHEVFPHVFNKNRISNKDPYRRPIKLKEGTVHAYISHHDLPEVYDTPAASLYLACFYH